MFDSQFRLSPDFSDRNPSAENSSANGPWPQISLDRLLEHHDITPAKPINVNDHSSNNDFWSSSAQFKEFFNNYHQNYPQQPNQPIDISSLLSSSPPQQIEQQQQQQQQQNFDGLHVNNHIFEPEQDPQPVFYNQYPSNHSYPNPVRQDARFQHPHYYPNRTRSQYNPPILQIPSEDHYHQQQQQQQQHHHQQPRYKQSQAPPAYIVCLNHGINYNGVSGPPILLPPSF